MSGRMRGGALTGALLLALGTGSALAGEPALPAFTDTLQVAATERVVCLSRRFVLLSTLQVQGEGGNLLEPGVDYEIDPDAGCLTLLTPDVFGAGRVFVASYRALPLSAGVYRLREDPHQRTAGGGVAGASSPDPAPGPVAYTGEEESRGLTLSGSESFGIQIGNRRDLSLEQALDLRLSGTVGRDVKLLAILSDQNLPFQPDGNTAELAELDRVLVQVESPRAGAQLGDVSLVSRGSAFLSLERELEGLTGNANLSRVQARGAVASAKGEFTSAQFFGSEGKQGPYRLTEGGGVGGGVVVAGTERVWMNGQLLSRGQEEDYVIDYGLGEITFTSKRVITANSEISVDYQVASNHYRRQVSFGEAAGSLGGLGSLKVALYQEGDDPNRSLAGDLSPEEKAQLAALGDEAQIDGGTRYVGPGLGDYQLVVDAVSGSRVFRFVDGTGDYDVQFVDVGEKKGMYEAEQQAGGRTVFNYVGAESGSYVPRQDLPPPARTRVGDVRWDLDGEQGSLTLEGSTSDQDRNLLSSLHDADNAGSAYLATGSLAPIAFGSNLSVAPRVTLRHVDDTFRSPGRTTPSFYGRDWNLTGTQEIRGQDLQEAGLETRWGDRLVWQVEGGRLALGDTLNAVRQLQNLRWQDRWVAAGAGWITTRNEVNGLPGNLNRKSGDVVFRRYPVQPRVSALHETRVRDGGESGERHRDLQLALTFPVFQLPVTAEVGGGRRQDDSLGVSTGWYEARQVKNTFGQLVGSWPDLNVLLRYEARRVTGPGRPAERFDTGRLDLRHQAARGAWTAVATANVGTIGLRRRTKTIVPTDSTGYFDQFGNYVGAGGGYDVRYGGQGDETLTGSVDLTTRLRWGTPSQDVNVAPLFRAFAWEGYFNLTELSSLSLSDPANFLSPHSYLNRGSTLDGRWNLRQTLDLFPSQRKLGLRLRHEARRRLLTSPQGDGQPGLVEVQGGSDVGATLRSNPAPGWDAELEGNLGRRHEEVDPGTGIGFLQVTHLRGVTARGGKRLALARGNGRLSAEATYSQESGEGKSAVGWVARPRFQWFLAGWGRFDARYTRTKLVTREGFTALRGVGAPTLLPGWRLDLVGELKLHRSISVTSAIAFDHPEDLFPVTEGRMEVRGTF